MRQIAPDEATTVLKAALVSLAGLYFHNWWDLPHLSFFSVEYVGPTAAFSVIFGLWWIWPDTGIARLLVWIWALAHLVGGGIFSVLPLDVLPFEPEQSLRHYFGHLVYVVTQVPLIFFLIRHRVASGSA